MEGRLAGVPDGDAVIDGRVLVEGGPAGLQAFDQVLLETRRGGLVVLVQLHHRVVGRLDGVEIDREEELRPLVGADALHLIDLPGGQPVRGHRGDVIDTVGNDREMLAAGEGLLDGIVEPGVHEDVVRRLVSLEVREVGGVQFRVVPGDVPLHQLERLDGGVAARKGVQHQHEARQRKNMTDDSFHGSNVI